MSMEAPAPARRAELPGQPLAGCPSPGHAATARSGARRCLPPASRGPAARSARVASFHLSGLHAHTHPRGRSGLRRRPRIPRDLAGSAARMTSSDSDSDLKGRVALVTGASRGIGAATALWLAEAGADVAVGCSRHREQAAEIAEKIISMGRRAVVVSGDLADPDVPGRLVAETAGQLGPPGVLVANAGTGPRADFADVDVPAWDNALNVNLRAPFFLAQAAIPDLREQGYGR